MCMIEYAERYDVMRQVRRTARKEHTCCECRRVIQPGERYVYTTGRQRAYPWDTWHMCAHCDWAANWLRVECNGFLFGGVLEDLEEHWQEESLMRSLDLGRRIVGMRRRWRDKQGNLMLLPV